MLTVYGLKSCDACRKARKALADREHRFHDLREDGLDAAMLDRWIGALGWEALLNRRSTTWRALDEAGKGGARRRPGPGPDARASGPGEAPGYRRRRNGADRPLSYSLLPNRLSSSRNMLMKLR